VCARVPFVSKPSAQVPGAEMGAKPLVTIAAAAAAVTGFVCHGRVYFLKLEGGEST